MSVGRCGRCAGGREVSERFSSSHGLQHIGACQSAALYAANTVREARGASERRADGAGRARAAHAHHVALHCHAERPIRGGGAESMEANRSQPLGHESTNGFCQLKRTDTARRLTKPD